MEHVGKTIERVLETAKDAGARRITLRCSSLPIIMACPAVLHDGGVHIDPANPAAAIGTAAHEAFRPLVESGYIDWEALPVLCQRHGVDETEVRILCAWASQVWAEIADSFPDAQTEVPLAAEIAPGLYLTGHKDILSRSGVTARGADFKTGRKDSDYRHQVFGYAALTFAQSRELEEISETVIWVRDREVENYTLTRGDVADWVRELVERVATWDGRYRPGNQCQYCPRSHDCQARNALVRRDVAALLDRAEAPDLSLMKPEEIVRLVHQAEVVGNLADAVRKAARQHVLDHGDVVGDGTRLTIQTEKKRKLDTAKAWPVLEEAGFDDADLADVVELSAARIDKRIASKAGRGKGAAAVREIQQKLDDAGALSINEINKLVTRRA